MEKVQKKHTELPTLKTSEGKRLYTYLVERYMDLTDPLFKDMVWFVECYDNHIARYPQ